MKNNLSHFKRIQQLYFQIDPVLKNLDLPQDAVRYYAEGVLRASSFDFIRRQEADRYLHLIAFLSHQYFSWQDNLVDVFLRLQKG